ncbi:hypothetical protein EV175_002621 [Coemansia sp. RSA 1933]|nr:hypothetical protein EV175_002621 [Coemansia sp. RSA 1933]
MDVDKAGYDDEDEAEGEVEGVGVGGDEDEIDGEDSTYVEHPSDDISEDDENIDCKVDTEELNAASTARRSRFSFVKSRMIRTSMENSSATLRSNFDNEADVLPIDLANRTMMGILANRELDVTRHILMTGDTSYTHDSSTNASAAYQYNNLITWPATDLYRYLDEFPLDDYKSMGIYPQDSLSSKYECISLEEPGEELDSQRINLLDGDDSMSSSDKRGKNGEDTGYTGYYGSSPDVDLITDPMLNGGIGLAIKRNKHPNTVSSTYCDDDVCIMTRNHVRYPWLLAPRYSRVPLRDEFCKDDGICSSDAKELIDMTRAQVLNQI